MTLSYVSKCHYRSYKGKQYKAKNKKNKETRTVCIFGEVNGEFESLLEDETICPFVLKATYSFRLAKEVKNQSQFRTKM